MQNNNLFGLNMCMVNPGLTATAAATTVTLANAITVALVGLFVAMTTGAKALVLSDTDGVSNLVVAPTLVATATTGQASIIVHCVNAAGVLRSLVGPVTNIDANGNFKGAIAFPSIPDNLVPIGFFTVKNPVGSSTATFTYGTTNWNATSIVTTAYSCAFMPARPLLTA